MRAQVSSQEDQEAQKRVVPPALRLGELMQTGQERRQREAAGLVLLTTAAAPHGHHGSRQSQDFWRGRTKPPGGGVCAGYLLCAGARTTVMSATTI